MKNSHLRTLNASRHTFVMIYKKRCIPITPDKNASHTNKTNTLLASSQTYVEKRL